AVSPSGEEREIALDPAGPGLWRALVETEELGLHRLSDAPGSAVEEAPLSAVAVVGPPSPQEFANPISTADRLAPLIEETRGGVERLKEDGVPSLRRVSARRSPSGDGWVGLVRREAYEVRGATLSPLAPSWLAFAMAALFLVAAWRVEGR
ncbi:MAG: hypothetical protein AAFW46_07330, partial [Pseudomonadota bacterium]